jgi:hypothetical protein
VGHRIREVLRNLVEHRSLGELHNLEELVLVVRNPVELVLVVLHNLVVLVLVVLRNLLVGVDIQRKLDLVDNQVV